MQPDKQLNRYIHSGFGSKERTIIKSIFLIQYMLINNIFRKPKITLRELLDLLLQKNNYALSLAELSPKIHN